MTELLYQFQDLTRDIIRQWRYRGRIAKGETVRLDDTYYKVLEVIHLQFLGDYLVVCIVHPVDFDRIIQLHKIDTCR